MVGLVRVGLGCAAMLRSVEAHRVLSSLTEPEVLSLPWIQGIPEPTPEIVLGLTALWFATALAFTIGFFTRSSGALLSLTMAASIAIEQQAYSNHLYLLIVLISLFILTEPGAALSFDARRRGVVPDTVAGWPIFLMKLQISVVYFFAAVTKLNAPFLSGSVLLVRLGTGLLPFPEILKTPQVLSLMAISAVAVELSLSFLLWRQYGRRSALAVGAALHVPITLFLAPVLQIVVFSMIMLSAYGLFFSEPKGFADADSASEGTRSRDSSERAEVRAFPSAA